MLQETQPPGRTRHTCPWPTPAGALLRGEPGAACRHQSRRHLAVHSMSVSSSGPYVQPSMGWRLEGGLWPVRRSEGGALGRKGSGALVKGTPACALTLPQGEGGTCDQDAGP